MNYTALSTPEKVERLHNLHSLYCNTKQRLTRLRAKIALATEENGIEVDEELHGDLHQIITENAATVAQSCPEDGFQPIFWDEQIKAASVRGGRGMRWHPLLIKWCLYLRHLSSGAYEMLRSSITVPEATIPANLAGLYTLPQHYCWVLRPGRSGVGTSGCHHYLHRGAEVHNANP